MNTSLTKIYSFLVIISLSFFLGGCKTPLIFGKKASAEQKAATKVENVEKRIAVNASEKMEQVAVLASGTDYAINKVTNKEPPLEVAKDINKRVISLAGKPNLDAEKEIWKTVDQLTSDLEKEKQKGIKSLQQKDNEISALQDETKVLSEAKDKEINKYMQIAADTAKQADTYKSTLNEMNKWFGLGAVFYGFKRFIISCIWIISIGGIVYLLLRAFASSNPVVGAIFSIVEQVMAGFIKLIQGIAPKATQFANLIPKQKFDEFKHTLDKIVDSIEYLKKNQKETGKNYTLDEVLSEVDKNMNDDDKNRIDECKKDLNWN